MTGHVVVYKNDDETGEDKRIHAAASQKGQGEQRFAVAAGHDELVIDRICQKGHNKQNQYDVRDSHSSSR